MTQHGKAPPKGALHGVDAPRYFTNVTTNDSTAAGATIGP